MKAQRLYFLVVPIIIILASGLFVATDKVFYIKECKKLNTDCQKSLLFVDYLKGKGSLLSLNLTQQEQSHMQDVKNLFANLEFIFLFFSVLTISMLFFLLIKDKKRYRAFVVDYLFFGGISLIIFILVLSIFSLAGFDFLFDLFHRVFFSQGNYLFSTQSTLITLFPSEFFFDALKRILISCIVIAIFFVVVAYLLKKRNYDKV